MSSSPEGAWRDTRLSPKLMQNAVAWVAILGISPGETKGAASELRISPPELLLQGQRRPARSHQLLQHLPMLCWPLQPRRGRSAERDAASEVHGPETLLSQDHPEMCPCASPQHRCGQAQSISHHFAQDATAAVIAPADGSDTEPDERTAGCSNGKADHIVRLDVAGAAAAGAGAAGIEASPGSRGVAGTGEPPSDRRPSGTAAVDAC